MQRQFDGCASHPTSYMEIHEIEKQKMDALSLLSTINMKASEARIALSQIQEEETLYLVEREKKAFARIQKVVEESSSILEQAYKNYEDVNEIVKVATEFTKVIQDAREQLGEMHTLFEERNTEYDKNIKKQEEKLLELKKILEIDRTELQNSKKTLEMEKEKIKQERKKIQDERGTLERAINRLKQGRI